MSEESILGPEWFTPPTEEGKENPNSIKVRGLDSMEALDVTTEMTLENNRFKVSGKGLRAALRLGVMDAKGRTFENGLSHDAMLKLGPMVLQAIGMKIVDKTRLGEAEIKN